MKQTHLVFFSLDKSLFTISQMDKKTFRNFSPDHERRRENNLDQTGSLEQKNSYLPLRCKGLLLKLIFFVVNHGTQRSTFMKDYSFKIVSEIWLGKVIRIPVVATYTNDLLVSVTADPGFPGLWGVPSQVSRLSAAPGSPSDQHQPGSTQPLWTRQPGAASGAGAGTGDWGHFRASSRFRFRVRVRFRKRGSSRVELRSCVRLWFRGMYGGWGRASGWNSGIFPGSRNPKEDVPPRTTDTSGLKDTTETQLRPRGELRKRWRGEEGGMEGGIQRMWEMFYPAVSAVPAVPRGTLAIKKHLLNLPPKPFRHPATVYSSFHLWPRGRTHSSQRAKPGKGHTNGWGLSLSLSSTSLSPPQEKSGAF